MASFSVPLEQRLDRFLRPVVQVGVGDPDKVDPQTKSGQGLLVRGLVDTGAEITCITPALAHRLAIKPNGEVPMNSTSHRSIKRNTYRVAILIMSVAQKKIITPKPDLTPTDKTDSQQKKVEIQMRQITAPKFVLVGEFTNSGAPDDVEVLIGMDIIRTSTMIISGNDNRLIMHF